MNADSLFATKPPRHEENIEDPDPSGVNIEDPYASGIDILDTD
jgi:hypothetical protein